MKTKRNTLFHTNNDEKLPLLLEKLREERQGFKVPHGFFDSLSPRIMDEIKKQDDRTWFTVHFPVFRKPKIWAPVMASMIVVVLLIFVIPLKKEPVPQVASEWTQISSAYDASYAEEAILAESNIIDNQLENTDVGYIASASFSDRNEPTEDEITKYLIDQDVDTEILNDY